MGKTSLALHLLADAQANNNGSQPIFFEMKKWLEGKIK
jgi:hypothetical protein